MGKATKTVLRSTLDREGDAGYAWRALPGAAHVFIVNPLTASGVMSLFSTHPPAEERNARLRKMVV